MTPQELKNSILQRAIQGRLVEQRPEEGTGEELYREIQAEKQRLTRAGKIKREKPLPEITEDEIPFDIPESWKWVRIANLGEVVGGGTPKTGHSEYWDEKGVPWLTPADMKNISGKFAKRGERNISSIGLENSSAQLMPEGSVLYSSRAPIGYIAIAANDISTNQGFKSLVPAIKAINDYIYYCLIARTHDIISRASGTTFKEISGAGFGLTLIPLPPLAEQRRIVAKIEELLPYLDRYTEAWNRLETFNKRFPSDMRKSLLQLAIQGRLVEQRPEEGTGEELYRAIQTEKRRRIQAGELKREKPLPEIAEDEIPFEIPESWMWVRWGNLSDSIQYGYNAPAKENAAVRMVRISDIQNGQVLWETVPYCDIKRDEIPAYLLKVNDILFARTGGTVGKSYLVKQVPYDAIYAGYLIRTRYSEKLCPEYLYYFMDSQLYWSQLRDETIATAQPNCNGKKLSMMVLPLPPIAEQRRIVARVEELLPLCERLK